MADNLICPNSSICEVYKNWVKYTKDNRLGIIIQSGRSYSCLALDAINDPEPDGIPAGDLEKRLPQHPKCSHIELLNLAAISAVFV